MGQSASSGLLTMPVITLPGSTWALAVIHDKRGELHVILTAGQRNPDAACARPHHSIGFRVGREFWRWMSSSSRFRAVTLSANIANRKIESARRCAPASTLKRIVHD
jgi:hypothetical protein